MEHINEKVADLIDSIDSGDNLEAENILKDILQDKIDAILGIAKEEVAASMFNTEECADCGEELEEGEVKAANKAKSKAFTQQVGQEIRTRSGLQPGTDVRQAGHPQSATRYGRTALRDVAKQGSNAAPAVRLAVMKAKKAMNSSVKEDVEDTNEALTGNQHKIDANKNGKIDAQDFKMLRKKKVKEAYSDPYAAKKAAEMKKKKEEEMAAAKKEYDASQEAQGKINTKKFMKMEEAEYSLDERNMENKAAKNAYMASAGGASSTTPARVPGGAKSNDGQQQYRSSLRNARKSTYNPAGFNAKGKSFGSADDKLAVKAKNQANAKSTVSKVTKEEVEQVDEISKKTLGSYVTKAAKEIETRATMGGEHSITRYPTDWSKKNAKKVEKRQAGVKTAVDKMTKEEMELDEASYSAKMARAGKDIGKPGKMFRKIASKAARKYGKERGAKIAGAVLAKLRKQGK